MALDKERITSFDKEYLTKVVQENIIPYTTTLERLRKIKEEIQKIPQLLPSLNRYHMSREEMLKAGIEHIKHVKKFKAAQKVTKDDSRFVYGLYVDWTPYILHYELFIPSLEIQASPEQRQKWLPMAENLDFVGCYAQTELGHGSNVRGLETEAIYDHLTKEFIFHSPTITATKW